MTKDEDAQWLFGGEGNDNGEWEAHRRFISDTYNPIYRQGVIGAHHLSEAAFVGFLRAARTDTASAAAMFMRWVEADRPQGGDYGEVAMERIAARAPSFDAETARGIVSVFAAVMDDQYRARPKYEMFSDTWQKSERILRTFCSSVPEFDLGPLATPLARSAQALAWLVNSVARSELWAHGLAGDRRKDETARLLTEETLKSFLSILADRIRILEVTEILRLPRLGGILFTIRESPWHTDEFNKLMRRLSGPRVRDELYILFLESLASPVVSSNKGIFFTISPQTIHLLVGENEFNRRWNRISGKSLPPELEARRARIAAMMAAARDW